MANNTEHHAIVIPHDAQSTLTQLVRRLEAATSRLEDIAASTGETSESDGVSQGPLAATSSAPELPALGHEESQKTVKAVEIVPPQIEAMDGLMITHLDKFVESSKSLDGLLTQQAEAVARAFAAQRQYLPVATKAKKPDASSPSFSDLITDLQHEFTTINDIKESNRVSPLRDHLAMVADGIGALQWIAIGVAMQGKPADHVAESLGGAQFYGNRVLLKYKETEPAHVAYVQAYYSLYKALQAYVREYYPSGVPWNPNGVDASTALQQVKDHSSTPSINDTVAPHAASGGGGGPPPPPPPPPLPSFDVAPPPPPQPAVKSVQGGDMSAIFDQLNRGGAVTSGLKKVDKSQMTHKNPSLRAGASASEQKASEDSLDRSWSRGPETESKPESMRAAAGLVKKAGKKELDGNKWIVENFEDTSAPLEIEVSNTQSVLVSRCRNTTIRLIGKANAVSLDNCARTNLIIDSLISSVDVIKSPNFALQVLGSLPTIMLDQVDSASIYLSKDSLGTELFTSKCTSVNVNLPPKSEEDDYRECPLPEQIRSFIKDEVMISEIVEHAG
ncbi:suppressor of rasval19 [Elasticomyces elasticus]|nr:suppressor of rasval19 [Elasticomyces elasticus]